MNTETTTTHVNATRFSGGRKRNLLAAGSLLALTGALIAGGPASADEDPYNDDMLMKTCNGEPASTGAMEGSCTFEVQGQTPLPLEWVRYGEPLSNCNAGAVSDLKLTLGDVKSFAQSWTTGGGVSLNIKDVVSIEASGGYTETKTTTNERRAEVTAVPGYKNAVTAGTEYVEQTGRIRVDITVYEFQGGDGYSQSTETHYIDDVKRKAPTGHFETGQDNVPCSEDFQVPVG